MKMGWEFKVGKRYQITIRPLAPVLNIEPGDTIIFELNNGKIEVKRKNS